ncbi:ABC transporter ATP-binding protein [candidate division KSB1 bacterium]|nr:ABC transporter ATP-binding protein [candidate division KSB1 bacterium]
MFFEYKTEQIKKALASILDNDDKFIIQKIDDALFIEVYDERKLEKIHKTRAILIKYGKRPFILFSIIHIVAFTAFLILLAMVNANLLDKFGLNFSFLNSWVGYVLIIVFYLTFTNSLRKLINIAYYSLVWRKIIRRLRNLDVDDMFLIREFGQNYEFVELIAFLTKKFDRLKRTV